MILIAGCFSPQNNLLQVFNCLELVLSFCSLNVFFLNLLLSFVRINWQQASRLIVPFLAQSNKSRFRRLYNPRFHFYHWYNTHLYRSKGVEALHHILEIIPRQHLPRIHKIHPLTLLACLLCIFSILYVLVAPTFSWCHLSRDLQLVFSSGINKLELKAVFICELTNRIPTSNYKENSKRDI